MIMVVDVEAAEVDRAAGALACPRCGGRLRPWSWAPVRRIRLLDDTATVRPRRTRYATCRGTHLLLPSWCLPRRADAIEVVGTALVAHAAGRGHRRIATELGRPVSTVRRWLRAVRGPHDAGCTGKASSTPPSSPLSYWPRSPSRLPNSVTR